MIEFDGCDEWYEGSCVCEEVNTKTIVVLQISKLL